MWSFQIDIAISTNMEQCARLTYVLSGKSEVPNNFLEVSSVSQALEKETKNSFYAR